jgi:hypothetical protein
MAEQAEQKKGPLALLGTEMVYVDKYEGPKTAASALGLPAESGPQLICYYLSKIRGNADMQRAVLHKHSGLVERLVAERLAQAASASEATQPVSRARFNEVLVAVATMYCNKEPKALSYGAAASHALEAYGVSLSHEEVRRCCANNCEPFDAPGRRRQDWVPKRVEDILHELVVMARSMMLRVPKELIIGNLMKFLEGTKEE